uniref:C2H2-type domain-containing protein n=1 Tax=Anopheles christyi TaxID=43041 RepID=A0A240PPC1_9DIPT
MNENDKTTYAMCLECTENLKHSAIFRDACMNNDALFHELYDAMVSSVKEIYGDTVEYLDSDFETEVEDGIHLDELEDNSLKIEADTKAIFNSPIKSQKEMVVKLAESRSQSPLATSCTSSDEVMLVFDDDEVFSYSANYIDIGDPSSDNDEWMVNYNGPPDNRKGRKRKSFVKRKGGIPQPLVNDGKPRPLLPPAPTPPADRWYLQERPRVKRKRHLCCECGAFTNHLKSHIRNHIVERIEKCPHCPRTFKHATNLRGHIQQVHLKKICKTCEICGKGFIHHKTYRYHMVSYRH